MSVSTLRHFEKGLWNEKLLDIRNILVSNIETADRFGFFICLPGWIEKRVNMWKKWFGETKVSKLGFVLIHKLHIHPMILCVSVFVCDYMFEEMWWLIIFDTKEVTTSYCWIAELFVGCWMVLGKYYCVALSWLGEVLAERNPTVSWARSNSYSVLILLLVLISQLQFSQLHCWAGWRALFWIWCVCVGCLSFCKGDKTFIMATGQW